MPSLACHANAHRQSRIAGFGQAFAAGGRGRTILTTSKPLPARAFGADVDGQRVRPPTRRLGRAALMSDGAGIKARAWRRGAPTGSFAVMRMGTIVNTPRPAVTAVQDANSESNGRFDVPNACPNSPLWVSKGVAYRMPRAARQPRAKRKNWRVAA